jgi:LysM repeat protein
MKVTIETSILDQEADGKIDESGVNQETIDSTEEDDFFEDIKKNEQKPLGEVKEDEIPVVEHTIESGDTFGALAAKYNTTSKKIQELNPDVDPTKLQLGQKIRVMGSTKEQPAEKKESKPAVAQQQTTESADATYHTIESGDTFGALAGKYNTTSKKIQELNPDLDPTKLQLGQKVRVL